MIRGGSFSLVSAESFLNGRAAKVARGYLTRTARAGPNVGEIVKRGAPHEHINTACLFRCSAPRAFFVAFGALRPHDSLDALISAAAQLSRT